MLQGLNFTMLIFACVAAWLSRYFLLKRILLIQKWTLKMGAGSQAASGPLSFRDCQVCSYLRGEDKTGAVTAGRPAAALLWRVPILVAGAIGGTCCDTDLGAVNHVSWRNTIGIIREWSRLNQSALFEKHQIDCQTVYYSCHNVSSQTFPPPPQFILFYFICGYFLIYTQKY